MTGSGNRIERRRNMVVKTFGSRINFVKEQGIYEKLKGTGLAPEMISAMDGVIEMEYVEGENFYERFLAAGDDPAAQAACFEMFFRWYKEYRDITKISIGEIDFGDFMLVGDRLVCLDFEHCRPGSAEGDIARMAAMIALYPKGYNTGTVESAKLFVCVGASFMRWQPEVLAKAVPLAISAVEDSYNLKKHPAMAQFLGAYFTTAGVVLAGGSSSRMGTDKSRMKMGGRTMLEASAELISAMPRRIISVSESGDIELPGFDTVRDTDSDKGPMEGIVQCLRVSDQPWTLFLTCDMPLLPEKLLRLFLSCPKDDADAFMFEAGGIKQTFPLMLRTENAVRAMTEALEKGELKVQAAIEKSLKLKTIKAEDLREFDPRMLWNVNTPEEYQAMLK